MATTTILQPQDCLRRNPTSPSFAVPAAPRRDRNTLRVRRRKQTSLDNNNAGITTTNNNNNRVGDGRRLVVPRCPPSSNNSHLVMGQVRILKRGEELAKKPMMKIRAAAAVVDRGFDAADEDLVLSSTDRLGPDPETVQKHVRVSDGLYAGPASLLASPPPSSLPFPAFFAKERKNDAATSDLRRLLRLDLA